MLSERPFGMLLKSRLFLGGLLVAGLVGCAPNSSQLARTEVYSNAFSYQPVNPLTVWLLSEGKADQLAPASYRVTFLNDFSNDATRVAFAKLNVNGTFSFGPVAATAKDESAALVVDYIKYMTISIPVRIFRATTASVPPKIQQEEVSWEVARKAPQILDAGTGIPASTRFLVMEGSVSAAEDERLIERGVEAAPSHNESSSSQSLRAYSRVVPRKTEKESIEEVFAGSMPVYVGVGIRVRADFQSIEGSVKVTGLPTLIAEASAGRVRGSLSVQTMGITGPKISPLMPIPSDLSVASIQSAVQAAASVKTLLWEDGTIVQPMLVGFESPVTDGEVTAALTSFMYSRVIAPKLEVGPVTKPGSDELVQARWPNGQPRTQPENNPTPPAPSQ